ncbi:MAG TPA: cyclic pyranopterin monophosphate synthase MoaC [Solimonas sp.]|nr:cyclic pyranopterin monophosphate synthase MoaC [Solimonas sp.]
MRNISSKPPSLRTARAQARLSLPSDGVMLLRERRVEKGDALEIARMAGILAAKKTWDLLPLCHQLPLSHAEIRYELGAAEVRIEASVETVSGTGVEMEAMTAASIAALTLYDLLKPHLGQDMEIGAVRLLEKTGGKTDYARALAPAARGVLVAVGRVKPATVEATRLQLAALGLEAQVEGVSASKLEAVLRRCLAGMPEFLVTLGGTGIARDDRTVAAVRPLLDKELPGIMEAARSYGQARTPYALLSGGIAGLHGRTLVLTLPGSARGAAETLTAVGSGLVHILEGLRH